MVTVTNIDMTYVANAFVCFQVNEKKVFMPARALSTDLDRSRSDGGEPEGPAYKRPVSSSTLYSHFAADLIFMPKGIYFFVKN
jgi:hypothetical protein